MCRPASFVLTETEALWSEKSDSHEEIIEEHNLPDAGLPPEILRVEIVPPAGNWLAALSEWEYHIDQDVTPAWHDSAVDEKRTRRALISWAEKKLITEGKHEIKDDRLVYATGSSSVVAWGSSRVEAWGSSRVVARESSRVVARESSRVEAWGSSSVVARESSSVEARDSSSVEAWDSSSVEAWGSSRVVARDSSRVVARNSSSVVAWDSSSVVARDSSSVVAWGSSSVEARGLDAGIKLHGNSAACIRRSSVGAEAVCSVGE